MSENGSAGRRSMHIDIETRSGADLRKCGVYRYSEDPDFDILLFGYAWEDEPVRVIDLAGGESIPEEALRAVVSEKVIKWAFNTTFERICLSAWIRKHRPELFRGYGGREDHTGNYLPPESWRCSMIWSAYLGLPLSLEGVGAVLRLEEQKMGQGRALIRYFSMPGRDLRTGERIWHTADGSPEKWRVYKEYNQRDVEVEIAIQNRLARFPVPEIVWEEYHMSERINDRGIGLDREMVKAAMDADARVREALERESRELTQLDNPNSVSQMKEWLSQHGTEAETLDRKAVRELLKTAGPDIARALEIRQILARSSVKKYAAMESCVCADGRCRGMFQFYGANRSGRWAGRLIQLQNLPQNHMTDLAEARELVKKRDWEMLKMLYDDIPDTLSQLIRTAFIPAEGRKFIVADFSAIEARVIAHVAGEAWRTEVFRNNGDIYCASASAMFGVPVEKHGVNGHLRQKGKIAELALGYGGGVGALKAMGALEMGLKEEELQPLVTAWREANPRIVALWWDVDRSVKNALRGQGAEWIHGIGFEYRSGMLLIRPPQRTATLLCEAPDRNQPVRRRIRNLRGHRGHKEMGAYRKLWAEIRGKHRSGHQQGYPLQRHAQPEGPPDLRPCARRADHRGSPGGRPERDLREDGPNARLAARGRAAGGRILLRVLYEGVGSPPLPQSLLSL